MSTLTSFVISQLFDRRTFLMPATRTSNSRRDSKRRTGTQRAKKYRWMLRGTQARMPEMGWPETGG